jgi:hypothetical protein
MYDIPVVRPPLESRIRAMILTYDAFHQSYSDSNRKRVLAQMINLLKEVDKNGH